MTDLMFQIGCCSMCSTLLLETYGYHGGMAYEQKLKWDVGVRFQQFSALPLLLSRGGKNTLPSWLAIAGTSMFCVPLYYSTLTEDRSFNKLMPIGGVFMMASWLTLGLLS